MSITPFWLPAESDDPSERSLKTAMPPVLVGMMTLAFAVLFVWLSLARHAAFQSHAFDLGNMDQAVWNTIHGNLVGFTDMSVGHRVLTSRLAIHVEPLLLPLSVLYLIHPGPETLLVVQAVIVALGAPAAFLLARSLLGSDWLSLAFPVAYLLHPSLQNAVLDDFHAVTMSATFLLWASYFLHRNMALPFAIFAVLAASTKEEVGLLVGMLGVVWLLRQRFYAGIMTLVAGFGWFFVCVVAIIPSSNPSGHSPYLSRYSYLGHGLGAVIASPLRHPGLVISTLVSDSRLEYLSNLLHPVGFIALLGSPFLLLSLPALLINLLSADARMYSGYYQYSAEVVPYAIAGSAYGVLFAVRLARTHRPAHADWVAPVLCGFLFIAAATDSHLYGFTPIASGYLVPSPGAHQSIERHLLDTIPSDAVVAAADEIEPHLSDRRWIYLLPTVHPANAPAAEYVALDASIPGRPVEPRVLHDLSARLLASGYGVQSARDGILILRRGAHSTAMPNSFFSFIYARGSHVSAQHAAWGPLQLVGTTVHPRSGGLTRSRPAVEVEAFWRTSHRLESAVRITFYLSPIYSGGHPVFSDRWQAETDSPTWDWLPFPSWPLGRTIKTASLDMVPAHIQDGKVDVAIGVSGLGPVAGGHALTTFVMRLGTVSVSG